MVERVPLKRWEECFLLQFSDAYPSGEKGGNCQRVNTSADKTTRVGMSGQKVTLNGQEVFGCRAVAPPSSTELTLRQTRIGVMPFCAGCPIGTYYARRRCIMRGWKFPPHLLRSWQIISLVLLDPRSGLARVLQKFWRLPVW